MDVPLVPKWGENLSARILNLNESHSLFFQTIVSSLHYSNFLETAIPIFLQLLKEGKGILWSLCLLTIDILKLYFHGMCIFVGIEHFHSVNVIYLSIFNKCERFASTPYATCLYILIVLVYICQ